MWLLIWQPIQEKFPSWTHAGFTQKSRLKVDTKADSCVNIFVIVDQHQQGY